MEKQQILEKLNSLIEDFNNSGYESLSLILKSFAKIFESAPKD